MKTILTASAACALLVGTACSAAAATDTTTGPSVTVHHVSPVLQYRLLERLDTGGQIDGGSVRVTYTCDPGDSGLASVFAFPFAGGFMGPTFGWEIPCDDRRHTLRLDVDRRTDAPYDPPGTFVDTDFFLSFNTGPGGEAVPGDVVEPIRIHFVGF